MTRRAAATTIRKIINNTVFRGRDGRNLIVLMHETRWADALGSFFIRAVPYRRESSAALPPPAGAVRPESMLIPAAFLKSAAHPFHAGRRLHRAGKKESLQRIAPDGFQAAGRLRGFHPLRRHRQV